MIVLTSPTKQMDFDSPLSPLFQVSTNKPLFSAEAAGLNKLLEGLSPDALGSLMKISAAIADETYNNIQSFNSPGQALRPALAAYSGTVFKALQAETLGVASLDYAGSHLRIISGLYGLLGPLDLISAYRLEMKAPLVISDEGRLSSFWRARIAGALTLEPALSDSEASVINLASGEYSRVIDKAVLNRRVINFHFREKAASGLKSVGMYAKTARGLMLRRILDERPVDPGILKKGSTGGYCFEPELGGDSDWVFIR